LVPRIDEDRGPIVVRGAVHSAPQIRRRVPTEIVVDVAAIGDPQIGRAASARSIAPENHTVTIRRKRRRVVVADAAQLFDFSRRAPRKIARRTLETYKSLPSVVPIDPGRFEPK